jgi:hypothetical protein
MAKKPTAAAEDGGRIKVRVLMRCTWGAPDEVVLLTPAEVEQATASGEVDPHPDAVAYVESLIAAAATSI